MMRKIIPAAFTCFLCFATWISGIAQDSSEDAFAVQSVYETTLKKGQSYAFLRSLTGEVGHRLAGSENAAKAVVWAKSVLDTLGLDSVWLQPCRVSHWVRGDREVVLITTASGDVKTLRGLALGNSIGTGAQGIDGDVLEVKSLDELDQLPEKDVAGKVVFFNRPMDPGLVNTFYAYGRAVDQRWAGPRKAAEKGAVAAIVRSMTTAIDTVPHTGSTDYQPNEVNVPAMAISTADAELLSAYLRQGKVKLHLEMDCVMQDSVTSYSVIGEIHGSTHPDEIIAIGGHLDSWDVGEGAHDDGSGCVQAMDVLNILRIMDYVPRHTIRCVLFMNEENGLAGGRQYAAEAARDGTFHLAAIESDAGGFLPLGFGIGAEGTLQEEYMKAVQEWWGLMEPYGLVLSPGGGGADIGPLKSQGGMLFGMRTNSQAYFDYHHTRRDVLANVHPRELKLGTAALASLTMLLDKYAEPIRE